MAIFTWKTKGTASKSRRETPRISARHIPRSIGILIAVSLLLSSLGCAGPGADPSGAATNASGNAAESSPGATGGGNSSMTAVEPLQAAEGTYTPLRFPAEGQPGGYTPTDVSTIDWYLSQNPKPGMQYGIDQKGTHRLARSTDPALKEWETLPGYAWLGDPEISDYYMFAYDITDDGHFIGMVGMPKEDTGLQDRWAQEGSLYRIVYGDAEGYTVLQSGPYNSIVFDPAKPRLIAIEAGKNSSVIYDYAQNRAIAEVTWSERMPYSIWMVILGDVLYVYDDIRLQLIPYDMNSGERLEPLPLQTRRSGPGRYAIICPTNDRTGILLLTDSGVSHISLLAESRGVETPLIPFEAGPLSASTFYGGSITHYDDGRILITGSDTAAMSSPLGGYMALSYAWDPEWTPPPKGLEVYALTPSPSLSQAASRYAIEKPGAGITVTTGVKDNEPTDDALRTLATRMLAGTGPDVLILDGLPMSSYIRRGALADIRALLPEDGYEAVLTAYRQPNGAVPAIPTRFYVHTILGENVKDVRTLSDLADWLGDKEPGDVGVGPLGMIHEFYPIYGHTWIVDGKLDVSAFRADLEAMGRLAERFRATSLKNPKYQYNAGDFQAMQWYAEAQAAAVGRYGALRELCFSYTALAEKAGDFTLIGDGVFVASAIVGVNATSTLGPAAREVAALMLGDEMQKIDLGDGFPARRTMLEAQIEAMPVTLKLDPVEINWNETLAPMTFPLRWATKAEARGFAAAFDGLSRAGQNDEAIQAALREATLPYLLGEADLDSALNQARNTLELILMEAGN